jgi:dienelactone hydrolase
MILAIWACGLPPAVEDLPADSEDLSEPASPSDPAPPSQQEEPDSPSRCEVTELTLTCDHQTTTVFTGFSGLLPREVHWQIPLGEPPAGGWPAVILFQGSLSTAELFWVVLELDTFGYYNQGLVTKTLLDSGFAVLTPEAHAGGFTAWDTNIPPMSLLWEIAEDHQLMLDIFEGIEAGTFGELDAGRLYASGISSGGYMTSRMDLEYRERFRALAVHSASFATCAGPLCVLPEDLSDEHLPTLFLHGDDDPIVPVWTMELYRDALLELGVEVDTVIEPGTGHAWIDDSPTAIVEWFQAH